MKINKIICDACEEEIDVERDSGLAVLEYVQARPKISFEQNTRNNRSQMKLEKEITKTSIDLCKNCADIVIDFIEKKRQDKQNKKVEENKK